MTQKWKLGYVILNFWAGRPKLGPTAARVGIHILQILRAIVDSRAKIFNDIKIQSLMLAFERFCCLVGVRNHTLRGTCDLVTNTSPCLFSLGSPKNKLVTVPNRGTLWNIKVP